ncbi:hypothetical protein BXY57_0585 [Thermoflavifilum aggregans]|uniref:Glycosyltransferase A (GT-A) superfamily protein (DUF2064 family) n=1 Tax=Thermoflavifilum aggregans TaxID=454188 RepID=A0A2M9CSZ0_9BACT|nr:TIGR04282 family arsenosugar biosynthesis glycosyltransferase [Thermoflavifilum aggregans]PJJ75017.1 hypothetical protein BXY57_0585 [Thermoflavifilum aggregans]
MVKKALIIFVKNPKLGQVKTRLARTIGPHAALLIYRELLHHTYSIANLVEADRFVFYADGIVEQDLWDGRYIKCEQFGVDLGQRMTHAFCHVFSLSYQQAVIIGSDCFALTAAHIEQAFSELENSDVVIGPAEDGGYYLLGMKTHIPQLFESIPWSTPSVLNMTLQKLQDLKLSYRLLEELPDVDEWDDVPGHLRWLKE